MDFHFQMHTTLIFHQPKVNVLCCFLFILVPSVDKMLCFLFYFGVFAVNVVCVLFVLVCLQFRNKLKRTNKRCGFAAAQHEIISERSNKS